MDASAPFSRILLLMDNRGDPNWGSQATTTELVAALMDRFPGAELRGVPRNLAGRTRWRRSLGYRWGPDAALGQWRGPKAFLAGRALTSGWRDWIDWADLIVVNGEGTLHPQPQSRAWLSAIHYAKRQAKAPVWIVNSTIHDGGEDRALYDATLRSVEGIVCREPVSYEIGRANGWPVHQGADCAFLASADSGAAAPLLKKLNVVGPYAVATGAATGRDWDLVGGKRCLEAMRERGLTVIWTASVRTDRLLHERLDTTMPLVTEQDFGYRGLLDLIQGAELHVGGRYHPTIFSAMVGTPYIALTSNTHKMRGLAQLLDCESRLFEQRDSDGIVDAIANIKLGERETRSIELAKAQVVPAKKNAQL